VTLSTSSSSPDVIIVGCDCFPIGTAFSVKDTAGLTFTARTGQVNIGGKQFLQEWYAIAPSTLSSDVISVTTTYTGETWYGVVAFGVSGANTPSPFDVNAVLPDAQANNANCKNSDPCNSGVSTSNANDLVFQIGGDTGSKLQTAGAGMTLIQATKSGQDVYAQYELTSAPLKSATLSFGTSDGSDFAVIADAIVSSSSASSYVALTRGAGMSPGASSSSASPNSPIGNGSDHAVLSRGASLALVLFIYITVFGETVFGKGGDTPHGPGGRNCAVRPNRRAT
jgi:hypothetical protein